MWRWISGAEVDRYFSGTCCEGTAVGALARWAVVDGCIAESLWQCLRKSLSKWWKVPTSLGVLKYGIFNICLRAVHQSFFDYFFRGKNWGQVESIAKTMTMRKEQCFLLYKYMCISFSFSSSMRLGWVEWDFGSFRSHLPLPRACLCATSILPLTYTYAASSCFSTTDKSETQHHFSVLLPNIAVKAH